MKLDNPLLEVQSEKAGSHTIKSYSYQYHWALYRAITEHEKDNEYAIFVELHEDVIVSNSLNKDKATFEFNQVKSDTTPLSTNKLVSLKNEKSILGKLLNNTQNKSYSDQISEINLISASGFNLKYKEKKLKFEKINISDLNDTDITLISSKLKNELEISKLPTKLNFIIPDLKKENHQDTIIGKISMLISTLFPKARYEATHIYQLLIDELYRKGQNIFDYKKWEEAINNKALTSQKVTETINEFTSHKDEATIYTEFTEITKELELNSLERKELNRSLTRYKNKIIGSRSTLLINISNFIRIVINDEIDKKTDNIGTLIENSSLIIKDKYPNYFKSINDIKGAIIYEFITIE